MTWVQEEEWTALARELSLEGCRRASFYPFRWSLDALRRGVHVTSQAPRTSADWLHGRRDGHEIFVITLPEREGTGLVEHTLVVVPIEPPLALQLEIRRKGLGDRVEELVGGALHRTAAVFWGVQGFVVAGSSMHHLVELFSGNTGLALRGRFESALEFLHVGDDAVFSGSTGLVTRPNDIRHHVKIAATLAGKIASRRSAIGPTEDEVHLRELWARFATKLDLSFDAARLRAFGRVASLHLDIRPACTVEGWWTSVEVTLAHRSSADFAIAQVSPLVGHPVSTEDTFTFGHPDFDAAFVVRGTDEAVVRSILRTALLDELAEHARVAQNTITGPGRFSFEVPGRAQTDQDVDSIAERALALASAFLGVARVGPYR